MFKKTVMHAAILGAFAAYQPAFADEVADLKAEIAAQKQAADAQRTRLDALEQRLNTVQQQQAATVSAPPPGPEGSTATGMSFKQGQGLTYSASGGSVSLYGLIDVSYVHTNNANAKGDSVNSPRVAWFSGNRWGLTGRRAMGDSGLDAIFKLEAEYESQTGNFDDNTQMFGRDAWVGVQSDGLGKLTLGWQDAPARDAIGSAIYGDPYGSATPTLEEGGYSNNNNFKQLIFYAAGAGGKTRLANSVVWKKDFKNGLFASLAYGFNRNAPESTGFGTDSTKQATLAYAGGMFNVAGFVTSANVAGLTNKTYSIGGNVTTGPLRLNTGYYHYTAEQGALGDRKDNAYTVSAKFAPAGHMDYELGYQIMKANNAAVNGGGNVLNAFQNASTATATATGSRATLYTSAFYHFDKITEIYVAADYLKLKDGYKFGATNGFPNQTELAVGLRTRF